MAKAVVRVSNGRSLSGQFGLVSPGDLEGSLPYRSMDRHTTLSTETLALMVRFLFVKTL